MRSWWRVNVEAQLNRLPVNWDILFLRTWCAIMVVTYLAGGWYTP